MGYPTWVRVNAKRWESEEARDGVPDFVATRERDGWRMRPRGASAIRGFRLMSEVKAYVSAHYDD